MILFCLLGVLAGIIAGLIPGLHSNNITIILATTPFFGIEITSFILSMCITQSFVEFIPSTMLGIPSENTFESILPAHKMVLEGKGLEAINYTVLGGIIAVIIGALLTHPFFLFLEQNQTQLRNITPLILTLAIIIFIKEGKNFKHKIGLIFIILAAGCQGILFQDQLFPLITGYFGLAGLILSLNETKNIPNQEKGEIIINFETIKYGLIGTIGGAIVAIMPGIGSNTAGGIINTLKKIPNSKNYLTLLGSINTSNFFFSFATLLALSKARNGAMIAIQEKIFYGEETLFFGTIIMILSAAIGGISTILLAKKATKLINKKNEQILNKICIIFIIFLIIMMNGINGLITLIFSTALGVYTIKKGYKRSTLMSSLIIPTILFYLFILI
ncbi:MAG: tripartite tricarboxylate transporter permease [Candidatus ainarchaeum sp.]|jgi:putative membrane protein|nr:tripartite tricarboxylate transporter permease [Candidatus ainarchaeum sp.]MDD3085507.1 tripartite tricarboxylate transporter permease [Candidatus ainarchaeum sp.]MDD4128150.1 tripartite tricarboxylate transporter permease [Candidatus ainarchaeum sp.]MDD4467564.1 tripartite tricarboxylate transporter permease [Candidatus ainarchaeum sp.]